MAERVVIAELDINVEAFIKNTADIKKQIDQLKANQRELAKSGGSASKAFVQNSADLKVLSQAYGANVKTMAESTKATADNIARQELLTTVLVEEVSSIKEARNQNKLLNKLRNETNVSTKQGQQELKSLNDALDSNNEFIKENADSYLKQKINIGNYGSAVKGLSPTLDKFVNGLNKTLSVLKEQKANLTNVVNTTNNYITTTIKKTSVTETNTAITQVNNTAIQNNVTVTQAQTTAQKASTLALNAGSKALKIFRLALISTGIGAIVVALGSLIAFLSTTQKGIDAVTAVTRPLQAIFQSLIGVFQEVGEGLFDAFSNPKQVLKDLADFVKNNLINRFNAFGVILDGIINLDFKKIGDGFLQAGTGVVDLTGKIKKAGEEAGKFFADAAAKGAEIDRLTKNIEKSEIKLNLERQKGLTRIKELDRIAKDTSRNTEERLKANAEQNEIAQATEKREQNLIDLKIQRLKVEQTLNDTSREGEKELANLQAEREQSKQRALDEELKGIRVISQAQKEAQAQQKAVEDEAKADADANVEALQKQYDRELDLFVKSNQSKIDNQQFFTEESLRIEQARIDSISEKQRESAAKQLEIGTLTQQDYNDAINEINEENRVKNTEAQTLRDEAQKETDAINLENQRVLDQEQFDTKLELDLANLEIRKQAELAIAESKGADEELINQKYANAKTGIEQSAADAKLQANAAAFGAIAGFLGKESVLGKAAALAQTGINIQQGISKAIAQGGFAGIATGAVVAAKGAVSIAKIAGTNVKFEKGGISSIDGSRHAQGGVPIHAGGKYIGEAEGGEGIGILNRSAYSSFMDFNNSFNGGKSKDGFYKGGGIISRSIPDTDQSSAELLTAIQSLPSPVVTVEDIRRESSSFIQIETGANV